MSVSRRRRRLKARGNGIAVTVEVTIDVIDRHLTRDEQDILIDDAADKLMAVIPSLRYGYFPISKIKVGR